MKKITSLIITAVLILSCFCSVQAAEFKLPDLISDNMLIQRDMPVKLWGYGGTPGEAITIEIEDKKGIAINEGNTTINDKGFSITLPSMEAGGPYTIRFLNSKGDKLASVYNVLVGDLWFQGGQSNMQATIPRGQTDVPERVIPNPKDDTIRLFYNGSHISSDTPADDLKGEWIIADKKTVDYSAVGYKALETIHNALDIPVGGICSPYGGTTLSNFNNEDSGIYKAKVAPVTQFNIKGVMWYQGGTDCKNGRTAEELESGYKQLVSLLREKWNNKNLPFLVVQLHQSKMRGLKYGSTTDYSITDHSPARIAQSNLYMTDENVGMAVTMDLSLQKYKDAGEDPDHPWIKAPVGERLGNAALEMVYGKDVKLSPVYTGFEVDGNSIKVSVQDAYDGLKTSDGKAPWGFRIAGEDGVYYEAKASLSGNIITLTSTDVPNPVSASYGIEKHIWPYTDLKGEDDIANAPELPEFSVNVVNSVGLPLGAFSTTQSVSLISEINTENNQEDEVTADTESSVSSDNAGKYTVMADALYKLGLFRGTENGYELEKSFTRAEGAVMLVRLLGKEIDALYLTKTDNVLPDVKGHWSEKYVAYCYNNGITKGTSETTFSPDEIMTGEQFIALVMRAIGHSYVDPDNAPSSSVQLGLADEDAIKEILTGTFTRDNMVFVSYKALSVTDADGVTLIEKLANAGAIEKQVAQELGIL